MRLDKPNALKVRNPNCSTGKYGSLSSYRHWNKNLASTELFMNKGKKITPRLRNIWYKFFRILSSKSSSIDESSIIYLCVSITSYFRTSFEYLISIVTDNRVFSRTKETEQRNTIGSDCERLIQLRRSLSHLQRKAMSYIFWRKKQGKF